MNTKRISRIEIDFIPQEQQRYATTGDWKYRDDEKREGCHVLEIRVSQMPDQRHEQLVAVHELVEVLLCNHRGITQEAVDEFDFAYEKKHGDVEGEPGDEPDAPYQSEHCAATCVERMLCCLFGVKWREYEDQINALFK